MRQEIFDGEYSIERFQDIKELREMWERIYSGNPKLQPCSSYEFCSTFVGDYRFSRLRVFLKPVYYVIYRAGEPRIIAPLWRQSANDYYLIPDFLITPYRDLIYAADCGDEDFERAMTLLKTAIITLPPVFCAAGSRGHGFT